MRINSALQNDLYYTMGQAGDFSVLFVVCWMDVKANNVFSPWLNTWNLSVASASALTDRPCLMRFLEELNSAMAWNFSKATW